MFLVVSLAAGSLALLGCEKDADPAGESTQTDRFDGGAYLGDHTRSDLDAGAGPSAARQSGADAASDPDGAAAEADSRQRLGQDTGVGTGAGSDRDRAADRTDGTGGAAGTDR
jgi:hypothetical protein